ncbi:siderophore ABC transporter substrate-binding protein [Aneurinibacillus thermoaerophilus]|uniref:Iron complex transport system substrate-binding protein n=1 Tax=Aneurinibacillus thermoaerophilus TaxID=143495 RepID=A0A1G7YFI8_ANETH|nr:siderophore ABC transporter substrate-binding protein [Aneurinibacillus thermoaerophilus]MED0676524.1 siderophore ABC transporter substrate-binding protein [Aneurinibacillus thermoaerophilus]MED0681171.1 siderophore ABC transporter substrate-binding protein [Aneurinibacillus thermoaerophilus]MED0735648.1 siderophore ABC transporter substrate-binding protein [Aneurinibacillus thermoaerophilus]MED0756073.1 siderophore ABC transporter substrate-binding protein [Aneurinibacillus thermoaerophilus
MKKAFMFFIIAVLATLVVACGSNRSNEVSKGSEPTKESEEITIKHQLGETKVKKNPEKVVVFDYGTLDSLDKLGIEVAGLPKSHLPPYLAKFKDDKYANLGSLLEPDFEKINALHPDLIIISGRQSKLYDEFKKIAPTIYLGVDTKKYMKSFEENAKTLGKIFNKESEVEKELAKVKEDVKKLKEKASATGKNALIILANDGKVSAFGPSSRFGIIHDEFGFTPADKNIQASTHGKSISFEYIVEKNPDYLFVIDRGAVVGGQSSAKQVVENELVKNTKAYKNGNVVYLDPNYWYLSGGGLVSVSEMVKEVEASIK